MGYVLEKHNVYYSKLKELVLQTKKAKVWHVCIWGFARVWLQNMIRFLGVSLFRIRISQLQGPPLDKLLTPRAVLGVKWRWLLTRIHDSIYCNHHESDPCDVPSSPGAFFIYANQGLLFVQFAVTAYAQQYHHVIFLVKDNSYIRIHINTPTTYIVTF